ncbi:hypothetical protein Micbo1qcDRAFT_172882 [Microdochium bolleyi]|uniref:Uncharacterized protein n=1 Tax=Microdochium bolleyi TaxID=196109 RepID=A0A136JA42_9PEZI|nr:hypothetical protein Micbo1qcDRAFT_172882 [Microdochium bolleyi]
MVPSPVEYIAAALVERATWSDSDGNDTRLDAAAYVMAWYIIILIVWLAWFFLIYAIAFIVYFVKERKRKHQGLKFRTGHVFWKAFCIASGLWFWIWVFKKGGCCGADNGPAGEAKSGMLNGSSYNHVEHGAAFYGASPQPQQQRFEPMGYNPSGGVYQHPYQQHPQQGTPPLKYDTPDHVQAMDPGNMLGDLWSRPCWHDRPWQGSAQLGHAVEEKEALNWLPKSPVPCKLRADSAVERPTHELACCTVVGKRTIRIGRDLPDDDGDNAAKAGAPGLTFLVSTNPRDAKSAATKKRVRQAAALKSWRDIKSEIATANPAPKRPRTGTVRAGRDAPVAVTWEGVPAFSLPLSSRPNDLASCSSSSSSALTPTPTPLSSTTTTPPTTSHGRVPSSAAASDLQPVPRTSKRRHSHITGAEEHVTQPAIVPRAAVLGSTTDQGPGRLRESFRHTIGWPLPGQAQLTTSPRIPSIQDIIEHQNAIAQRNRANGGDARARKRHQVNARSPAPCRVYCNNLDPFNCCPVKHRSWYDGVLHHMLTVFAPRAWPTLKITNEQGLQWEHFMTQHAFAEPALYYVRLLFAIGDMIALDVAEPQLKLWLQARAIEAINEALVDPARATSDALILAIGRIALNESLYGDKVAAHTLHRPAQARMILMRGGMNALDFPPLVKRLMRWADKVMSMQGGTLRMIPDDAEPHYTDATSVDVLEKWAPRQAMALRNKAQTTTVESSSGE